MNRGHILISACLLIGWSPLRAEEPRNVPKQEADPVEVVRKFAARAEVHGVGISQPNAHGFGHKDVTNWPGFVGLLRKGEGPAGRIWQLLPKKRQEALLDDALVSQLGPRESPVAAVRGLKGDTAYELREMIGRPDFYTEKAFKDVPLDKKLQALVALGEKRTRLQTLRLNRGLLASAFPGHIAPLPDDYHAVRIRVKAGKPVILVLTASVACEWRVEVEEGGEVVGVILGGGNSQEVTGLRSPVVDRASSGPDGKRRTGDVIWSCNDRDDKSFAQLEGGVKKLTDKSFTEFQGWRNELPKEGFVVKPSAK